MGPEHEDRTMVVPKPESCTEVCSFLPSLTIEFFMFTEPQTLPQTTWPASQCFSSLFFFIRGSVVVKTANNRKKLWMGKRCHEASKPEFLRTSHLSLSSWHSGFYKNFSAVEQVSTLRQLDHHFTCTEKDQMFGHGRSNNVTATAHNKPTCSTNLKSKLQHPKLGTKQSILMQGSFIRDSHAEVALLIGTGLVAAT